MPQKVQYLCLLCNSSKNPLDSYIDTGIKSHKIKPFTLQYKSKVNNNDSRLLTVNRERERPTEPFKNFKHQELFCFVCRDNKKT